MQEWHRDRFRITTDPARVDLDVVHGYLTTSYWAWGITRDRVARSIAGAIPFAMLHDNRQVGFARVISDRATFAWVADVFILPGHRDRGLGIWLVESILAHPDLQGLRRWSLSTRDAHLLYARFGFTALESPERMMQYRPGGTEAGGPEPRAAQDATTPGGSSSPDAGTVGASGSPRHRHLPGDP